MEENSSETVVKEQETIQEPVIKPIKVIFKTMKVTGCDLLNVRMAPSLDSEIKMQLKRGSTVNVNLDKSNDDYYYVASETSNPEQKIPIHGFCKKDFLI